MALLLNRRLDETDDLHIALYVSLLAHIPVGRSCRCWDDDDVSMHMMSKKMDVFDHGWMMTMMMHDGILPCLMPPPPVQCHTAFKMMGQEKCIEIEDQQLIYKMHRQQQTYQVDVCVFVCEIRNKWQREREREKEEGV